MYFIKKIIKKIDCQGPEKFCHDNPMFDPELIDGELIDSKTQIVITAINKNTDSPLKIAQSKNYLCNELTGITNEAALVLKDSNQNNTSLVYFTSQTAENLSQSGGHFQENFIVEKAAYNTTHKLAAAAAAASVNTLVEIPNFGQNLSTMMKQSRMVG